MPLPRPLLYAFDAARAVSLRFYAAPLDEGVRVDPSNPKWIQLCTAGRYVYRDQPVEITGETFDRMIQNFRAHPAFDAGARSILGKPLDEAAKLGAAIMSGVVALNFDHPPHGAPRPGHGWFLDVERRGDQLWGLCWFDAEAHAGMLAGTWKWTSIEWSSETLDNRGQEIGPYLSGVALTNDPFITGMTPIQLSRPAAPGPVVWFGPVADVLCSLRSVFALPETADVAAIIGEVAKLRMWALGEQTPPLGVDVGALVARIRGLLNLPTLADPASIFRELDKLLGLAADEQEKETPMPPDPTKPAAESGNLGLARLFAARLSAMLRVPVSDDEGSVLRAFDAATGKYDEAMGHVDALAKIFQTTDPKAIAEKLAALQALAEQMTALLGEVAAEHTAEEQAEGQMAAEDVQQVMSAQRLDPQRAPGTVAAYTAHRLGFAPRVTLPTAEQVRADPRLFTKALVDIRKAREARRGARKAFFSAHGIDAVVPVPAHLQHLYGQQLFAGNGAVFGAGNVGAPPPAGAQGQAPQHFAQPYQGAPLQGGPPPAANVWSWARVSQLPPAQNAGDNIAQRIFEEVVRTEFGGVATGPKLEQAWRRANDILNDISRREGPAPASLFTRA